MKHSSILRRHLRPLIILALCLSIPFLSIWYILRNVNEEIFYEQKSESLMSIAQMMDMHLPSGGYEEILADAEVENGTKEQKIEALNAALWEITDEVAAVSEGLGVGYYSRELDAILTYGPSIDYADRVGIPINEDHPGREVMRTNTPGVSMGTMVRGDIMNAMYPVEREGEVIGYIWANALTSDLELALQRASTLILVLLAADYVLMFIIVMVFLRRMIKGEEEARTAIAKALEETKHLDGLMHIVNEAVASLLMADGEKFEFALMDCMQMMGAAFDVDEISIWRYLSAPGEKDEEFALSSRWTGEQKDKRQGELGPNEFSRIRSMTNWRDQLARKESVKLSLTDLPEAERGRYSPSGFLSIIAVPVFLQDHFWGFVSFCNFHNEHAIAEAEEAVLLSGSLLMANAISRNEMMKKLVAAREEALSGTRAKSAFLASMSHEIRTPMNAIIGMAAIGKTAADMERKDYAFGKIEVASTHLLEVINAVLDISKIESGKLEIAPVTFDFVKMIGRVNDVFAHRMVEKDQIFLMEIDPEIPGALVADDQMLTQVIINLLSNASKFTPQNGTITLSAKLLGIEGEDVTLRIDVKDTGIGVAPDKRERIFNSFEQAESSTTRKYGGTGLGLAISKNIVEMMGGRIWLESEENKGSTFSFTIVAGLGAAADLKEQDKHEGEATSGEDEDDFTGHRILLAEDVEINREILLVLLEPTNLIIDCAENGAVAVKLFSENPEIYELILMDVQMPEMDGYEATRQIRAMDAPNAKTIPVIATTANVFKDDIERCLEAGMNGHVGKPLVLEEVLAVLRKYLR